MASRVAPRNAIGHGLRRFTPVGGEEPVRIVWPSIFPDARYQRADSGAAQAGVVRASSASTQALNLAILLR